MVLGVCVLLVLCTGASEEVSNHAFEHHAARAEKDARSVSLVQWSSSPGHVCDIAGMVPMHQW